MQTNEHKSSNEKAMQHDIKTHSFCVVQLYTYGIYGMSADIQRRISGFINVLEAYVITVTKDIF